MALVVTEIRPPATLVAVQQPPEATDLKATIKPGVYRWAIYDRKTRELFFGPEGVHMHMTVAEHSGVLRHPTSYYRPGGHVLGGFVCCSADGFYYYDPFSGTFPGTHEGVAEAEEAMREICEAQGVPVMRYEDVPAEQKADRKEEG